MHLREQQQQLLNKSGIDNTLQLLLFGKFRQGRSRNDVSHVTRIFYLACYTLTIFHVYVTVYVFMVPNESMLRRNLLHLPNVTKEANNEVDTSRSLPIKRPRNGDDVLLRPFPRWGKLQDEVEHGMDIGPILDFIVNSSSHTYISQQKSMKDIRYVPTTDHVDDVGAWLPETLYVVNAKGLWTSMRHRTCNAYGVGNIKTKVIPIEHAIQSALEYFQNDTTNACKQWPRLCKTLTIDGEVSGFPLLIYFGDFTGCNYRNYKGKYSVPLYTAAAHVDCSYTFPFPTHELLAMIRNESSEWDDFFNESRKKYPWEAKVPQVVWRGALTGSYVNDTYKNSRWNLIRTIQKVKKDFLNLGFKEETFLFNVGAVRLPVRRNTKSWINDLNEVGGLADRIDPMASNQMYRAILDMDGNSWSSRFNMLLCYNSVVIKVQPTWVDYLHFKRHNGEALQPWKHFIPVREDLSDLFEKAAFAMDPSNDGIMQNIVMEANMWCRQRLLKRSIEIDILDSFERYIEFIDLGNPEWRQDKWLEAKKEIFSSDSPLKMKLLTWDEDIYFGKAEADAYRIEHGLPLHTIKIES